MARSRLWVPIIIGVLAILFTIGVLVGWNIIFTSYYVLATRTHGMPDLGVGYWLILSFGSLFLVAVVVTLLLLLIGNVRQILYVNRQKTFIDNVTHELKSPLASLQLSLETMEQRQLTPEMQARFLAMMKKDVSRLRTFIDHVLHAGRLEHGRRAIRPEPFDCVAATHECVRRVREQYELQPDEMLVREPAEPARPILMDRVAYETVLLNLLDNAAKYSGRPARVEVRLGCEESRLVLRVIDQGQGIAHNQLKRIFRRFYRIEQVVGSARGTGLGLYLVHALTRRMGGKVEASSDGPGAGAMFTVRLPLRFADAMQSESSKERT
jgi:signal transduction histidine kinase